MGSDNGGAKEMIIIDTDGAQRKNKNSNMGSNSYLNPMPVQLTCATEGGMKNFEECKSKDEFFDKFTYIGEHNWYSSVKAKVEEAATMRNPIAFSSSSSSPSLQTPRPPLAQQKNQRGVILKRKKPNIRILLNGDERVVSPYFPLPPNAIVLDPMPQTSKRRAEDKGHIHFHCSDNVGKKKKATSDEMLVEKNLNYNTLKRKKPNIRILLNGDERVVSPYFPLPPNAIVLDPRPQTSKRRAEDKGHIHSHCSDNAGKKKKKKKKKKKVTSDEMLVEKNLNYNNFKRRKKKSITLSAAAKRLDIYKRVSCDNTWVAPRSHHQLLQEEHCYDPWRVLIICMLLNRTKGSQVKERGVLSELFKICPNAEAATNAQEEDLQDLLRPLGLHHKKAASIKRLSSEYLGSEWTHVTQLHSVGKYAADAYAIFCVGNVEEVTPLDHKLVDYWKFVCEKRAQGQQY